jgi:demethylmenaquinone methyltransferase/2-methoxy-6-polyprenyl-1,4-benzoquinol methylase
MRSLRLPQGSVGLDAGCGIGSHTLLLAEAVAPRGRVVGLDISPELLARARSRTAASALRERVRFARGDVDRLPIGDAALDWVWSVDCVWGRPDPFSTLRELARVVRPGGVIAVLIWSSQQLLPGYPLLEARLNATVPGIAPFREGMKPEMHFLRAQGWLKRAGLEDVRARTFVSDVCPPLEGETRAAMVSLLEMRWGERPQGLSPEDSAQFDSVCTPGSPDFILDSPDYYAFFTYTMFWGRKAG